MIEDKYKALLVDDLHADRIAHGKSSLYEHLAGVHALLKAWQNPDFVCLAGLFHSIYGTVQFQHATLPFDNRHPVHNLIGPEAERLAYLFCVTDRPSSLIQQWERSDFTVTDRHLGLQVSLDRQDMLFLLEIEAANLVEQRAGGWRYVPRLREVPLSPGARQALRDYDAGMNQPNPWHQ